MNKIIKTKSMTPWSTVKTQITETPYLTGLKFVGWSNTQKGDFIPDSYVFKKSKTIYAVWKSSFTSVILSFLPGELDVQFIKVREGTRYSDVDSILSAERPKLMGYKFSHWSLQEPAALGSTAPVIPPDYVFNGLNVTVYAVYTDDMININIESPVEFAQKSFTVRRGDPFSVIKDQLVVPDYEGHTFENYSLNSNGVPPLADETQLLNSGAIYAYYSKDPTFYDIKIFNNTQGLDAQGAPIDQTFETLHVLEGTVLSEALQGYQIPTRENYAHHAFAEKKYSIVDTDFIDTKIKIFENMVLYNVWSFEAQVKVDAYNKTYFDIPNAIIATLTVIEGETVKTANRYIVLSDNFERLNKLEYIKPEFTENDLCLYAKTISKTPLAQETYLTYEHSPLVINCIGTNVRLSLTQNVRKDKPADIPEDEWSTKLTHTVNVGPLSNAQQIVAEFKKVAEKGYDIFGPVVGLVQSTVNRDEQTKFQQNMFISDKSNQIANSNVFNEYSPADAVTEVQRKLTFSRGWSNSNNIEVPKYYIPYTFKNLKDVYDKTPHKMYCSGFALEQQVTDSLTEYNMLKQYRKYESKLTYYHTLPDPREVTPMFMAETFGEQTENKFTLVFKLNILHAFDNDIEICFITNGDLAIANGAQLADSYSSAIVKGPFTAGLHTIALTKHSYKDSTGFNNINELINNAYERNDNFMMMNEEYHGISPLFEINILSDAGEVLKKIPATLSTPNKVTNEVQYSYDTFGLTYKTNITADLNQPWMIGLVTDDYRESNNGLTIESIAPQNKQDAYMVYFTQDVDFQG